MLREIYEDYLSEHKAEIGSTKGAMSFEDFCEFYEIDESTSVKDLYLIFGA